MRLLVIWFGANDAAPPPKAQYVPLDRFRANLRTMLWTVRAPESAWYSPDTRVILMTPPPVSTGQRGRAQRAKDPPRENDREFETTRRYAEAVSEVGKAEGVPVVDLWGRLYEAAGRDEVGLEGFLTDGLHLNEKGYAVSALVIQNRWGCCVLSHAADCFRGAGQGDQGELSRVPLRQLEERVPLVRVSSAFGIAYADRLKQLRRDRGEPREMSGVDSEEKRILELRQAGPSLQTTQRSLEDASADGVLIQIIRCISRAG